MRCFSARALIVIVVVALSTMATGGLAQQPQRPEPPQQRPEELERVREAREAQEQARAEAIRRAQQQAQQARQRAQAAREQQRQRDNEPERSIVLPQDYPNASGEPVRSGVPMSTYTRMLFDLDPAYRMFGLGQLAQFDVSGFAGSEGFANSITHAIETRAKQDGDPGVRVFALYRLSERDMERAVGVAREALAELPHGSDAWHFILALLACADPDEFIPLVRGTLIELDEHSSGRNALWGAIIAKTSFEEFVSNTQTIALTQIARAAESNELLFSQRTRLPLEQPSITSTLSHMGRAYAHAASGGQLPEDATEHLAEAYGNIVRASFGHACQDDRVRAFLFARYLDIPPGDGYAWPFMATTLPEEIMKQAKALSTHGRGRSGSAGLMILNTIEAIFDQMSADAKEQERELLGAMRSALLDQASWVPVHTVASTRDNTLVIISRGFAVGLLPTDEARARLRALMKSAHESSTAAPWVLVPQCVLDAVE